MKVCSPKRFAIRLPAPGHEDFAHAIDGDVGGEHQQVRLRSEGGRHEGREHGDGRTSDKRHLYVTGRQRESLGNRISGLPHARDERHHVGHHALGKAVGWSEVRELFDQGGDRTGVIEPASTVVAFGDVRLERRRAESNLVVEELIDFVGQEMSVIHCASFYAVVQEGVQGCLEGAAACLGPGHRPGPGLARNPEPAAHSNPARFTFVSVPAPAVAFVPPRWM